MGPGGRVRGYEEWTIDDDALIAASRGHYDPAEYARQLEHEAAAIPTHRSSLLAQEADAAVEYFDTPASGAIVEVLIV